MNIVRTVFIQLPDEYIAIQLRLASKKFAEKFVEFIYNFWETERKITPIWKIKT